MENVIDDMSLDELRKLREERQNMLENVIEEKAENDEQYDPNYDAGLNSLKNEIATLDDEIDETEKLAEKSLSVEKSGKRLNSKAIFLAIVVMVFYHMLPIVFSIKTKQ